MARNRYRPGRTVAAFFIGLALAFGLVALNGTWSPKLGLDLQGGTRITLIATGSPTSANLEEARGIIDQRVNGSGVSEAQVTTQGSNQIVVQIPGNTSNSLIQTVIRQAQLRFRLVAQVPQTSTPNTPLPSSSASPGAGVTLPPSSSPTKAGKSGKPKASPSGKNRTGALLGKNTKKSKPSQSPSQSPSESPTNQGNVPTSTSQVNYTAANRKAFQDALTWMKSPDPQSVAVYNAFT